MKPNVVIKDLVTGQHEYFVFGTERFATIRPDGTIDKTIKKGEVIFSLYDHLGNNRVSFSYVGVGLNQYTIISPFTTVQINNHWIFMSRKRKRKKEPVSLGGSFCVVVDARTGENAFMELSK